MIVMKFGGSSVADAQRIRRATGLIKENLSQKPVLVLSAMGDVTDYLLEAAQSAICDGPISVEQSMVKITAPHLEAARELGLCETLPDDISALLADLGALLAGISLIKELSPRSKDFLVSFGERLSVRIASLYLNKAGVKAQFLDAWDAGLFSTAVPGLAEILDESYTTIPQKILPLVEAGVTPVVTGFISKDSSGVITTLGRGGSDLSATFIAAACRAAEVQVWKDVDGVLTADPRIVPEAAPVAEVTYEEAAELAYFGAQVLHPRAMQPCIKTGIPVLVKNSYNPKAPGTRISAFAENPASSVRSITTRKNITLIDIISSRMVGQSGFLAEVFASFAKYSISVDMLATSEVSVSLTVDSDYNLEKLKKDVGMIANVVVKTKKAIVTIICNVGQSSLILERAASVCVKNGVQIQMVSQGASKVNVSFIVNDSEAPSLVKKLHEEFFGGLL
ncbi:MAG: aspartate kinase [Spirochaetaceae bacterium]|jgi:aspartate kinase|nr:aspartate kinase [Spirochaetaceae bacterium]